MNFTKEKPEQYPRLMRHGDLVIVYERHDSLTHLYLSRGALYNNKFGTFGHDDMIGKPFGSKIFSRCSPGYLYMLEPTPELWSTALYTRTQIVNEMDASIINLKLDVHPGCVVVESGTGSGCMTLSLARAVYPNGHVHTFEYNGVRAEKAREEFKKLGVSDVITVRHKDVCGRYEPGGEGGFDGVDDHVADAVFLDLPEPWLALHHAERVLKPGANICCYSPCIEQVMKTCEKLRELKFHSIKMMEIRQRPFDGREIEVETLNLGIRKKKPTKTSNSNSSSSSSGEAKTEEAVGAKRKLDDSVDEPEAEAEETVNEDEVAETVTAGTGEAEGSDEGDEERIDASTDGIKYTDLTPEQQKLRDRQRELNRPQASFGACEYRRVARAIGTMKGHTAFLTFAMAPLK